MPYLSASAVVIHYEEALYQVYAPLPFTVSDEKQSSNMVLRRRFFAIFTVLVAFSMLLLVTPVSCEGRES